MPKLVSMKMTRAEQRETYEPAKMADDAPVYPYGLTVRLDNDALDKLGLASMPEVGKSLLLMARVDVVSVSAHDSPSGSTRNLELQITDLALDTDSGEGGSAADRLYNGDKAVT